MNQPIVWMNGEFIPYDSAKISIEDRGFQFSDGVYEVIRAVGGRYFGFPEHVLRLRRSLQAVEIEVPMTDQLFMDIGAQMLEMNGFPDALLYIQITRGTAPRSHVIPAGIPPTVIMILRLYNPAPENFYSHGVRVLTLKDERWLRCDIKSTALLANVLARERARKAGASEAIFVRDGWLMEATSANLFVVHNGVIATPLADHRILPGITRDIVIALARAQGMSVEERNTAVDELKNADEVFLTSTTMDVLPIVKIDENPVGLGQVGSITSQLLQSYRNRLAGKS